MKLEIEGIDYKKTLGPWIASTYKMLDVYMESVLQENNIIISKQQFVVLNYIKYNEGINQNELALFVKRDKTSITRFISTLLKKNYIEKRTCLNDKRANTLHITSTGLNVLNKTAPIFKKAILNLQKEVSTEEIEKTISSLKKIQEKINQIKK